MLLSPVPPNGNNPSLNIMGRTLRIECGDKLFDWFDVDEEKEIIAAPDVLRILKENVAHYFDVALEKQVIFDEEGVISTASELRRALRAGNVERPKVVVADVDNLSSDQMETWLNYLDDVKMFVRETAGLGTTSRCSSGRRRG